MAGAQAQKHSVVAYCQLLLPKFLICQSPISIGFGMSRIETYRFAGILNGAAILFQAAPASRRKYQALLGSDFFYYAETNMPREEPHEASEIHGQASLPYLLALLALCAHHGGPAVVELLYVLVIHNSTCLIQYWQPSNSHQDHRFQIV